MSIKEIEAEIKNLDLKDRATLAKWIVESLDDLSEAEVEALWAEAALAKMREANASMELAFSDDPSLYTAPIPVNELHEFLSIEGQEPTLETCELRAVHA